MSTVDPIDVVQTFAPARRPGVVPAPVGAPPRELDRSITTAIRHLIGADEVSVYVIDLVSQDVEPLDEGLRRGPIDAAYRSFLVDVADSGDGASTGPFWVPMTVGDGQSLVVRVTRRGATAIVLVADFRKPGPTLRARALRIVPELVTLLRHHVRTEERVRALEVENAAVKIALDHVECGIAVIDGAGTMLFANDSARHFLREGDGLHLQRGSIRPTGYAEAVRFRAALDAVTLHALPQPETAVKRVCAMAMLLPRRDGERPAMLVIAPCDRNDDLSPLRRHSGAAVLYILPADCGSSARLDVVCRLHGLSRIESLLLTHLVNGLTLAEAAAEIRVKLETARSYLKQVFAKTGTHRQVDAVALVSRYARAVCRGFDFAPA